MIRKAEYTEWIDNYLSNTLEEEQRVEFEKELSMNSELNEEYRLHVELQDAITEKEVLNLKKSLNNIVNEDEETESIKSTFDLLEDLEGFNEFEENVEADELLNYYESLPKLHIYQHEVASKENVHHFYKEQELVKSQKEDEDFFTDEKLEKEIEEAITEKEVMMLRDNLKQIEQSLPEHSYNSEEIDQYIENTMPQEGLAAFENELKTNSKLEADLKLHKEIAESLVEKDVIKLRDQLSTIMETQTSYNKEFEDIEQYIENELTEDQLEAFEEEMFENYDLKSDVRLHQEVDSAVGESDIMDLRAKLGGISKEIDITEQRSIFTIKRSDRSLFVRYAAAVSILLIVGLSTVFNFGSGDSSELYNKYYETYPSYGISRSATTESDKAFKEGLVLFGEQKYEDALINFKSVINQDETDPVVRFYAGQSYQNLEQYNKASEEYEVVIDDNDNMFVEQAQWYLGLCYVKRGELVQAKEQLSEIAASDSYYKPKAEALLRRLKYSENVEE